MERVPGTWIFLYKEDIFSSSKGRNPQRRAYNSTPMLHISASLKKRVVDVPYSMFIVHSKGSACIRRCNVTIPAKVVPARDQFWRSIGGANKKWLDKYFYWAIFHLPQHVSNTVSFTPPFGLAHKPKSISFSWKKCLKRGSSVLLVLFLVHLMFIINENVLWFKVPVSVTGLVNVGHRCSNLQQTLKIFTFRFD